MFRYTRKRKASGGGSASASAGLACSARRGGAGRGGMGAVNITASACQGAGGARHGPLARILGACTCRPGTRPRHFLSLFFSVAVFVFSLCSKYELKPLFRFLGELMKPGLRYHDCTSDKILLFIHSSS